MPVNLHQIKAFANHFFSARRNGHGIHSPFGYQLCEEVFYNKNSFYDFIELQKLRADLLANTQTLTITDFGAGSKTFKSNTRTIKDIAKKGISTTKQSELLYKLINFLNCKTSIELGTSLGLNTLYLALGNKNGNVTSIEGSQSLVAVASELAYKNNIINIQFIHSTFDTALPAVLEKTKAVDLLYIDGNHTYEATLHYFKTALTKTHNNSVIIFDDIYWSKGMTRAWEEIKQHPSVTLSIDTFYFGMVFFKKEIREKRHLRLFI